MSALEYEFWRASYLVDPWDTVDRVLSGPKKDKMIRDPKQMAAALNVMARRNRG